LACSTRRTESGHAGSPLTQARALNGNNHLSVLRHSVCFTRPRASPRDGSTASSCSW
jgi:hypothetical protein